LEYQNNKKLEISVKTVEYMSGKKAIGIFLLFAAGILISAGIFTCIARLLYIRQTITALGAISAEGGEINQTVLDSILSKSAKQTNYEKGLFLLSECGYRQSGALIIGDHLTTANVVFFGCILLLLFFLLLFLVRCRRNNIRYLRTVSEWISDCGKPVPPANEETSELIEAIESKNRLAFRSEQVLASEKEKIIHFMENVSHQLKTPISLIRLYCEKTMYSVPDSKDKMQGGLKQIDKMTLLIKSLLNIGMFDCGKIKMNYEEIRIDDFCEMISDDIAALIDAKGIRLIINDSSCGSWYFDCFWMKEAVENIIKNGIEHSACNTAIILSFRREMHDCFILISDNGGGIEENSIESIFDRFSSSSRQKDGSNGLGLSIAKQVVQCHLGNIRAFNNSCGGAAFEIVFPMLKGSAPYEEH